MSLRASMRAPVSHTQASDTESRRSWCMIKRRHRSYHAWVRSTTHRFGSTTKPLLSASTGTQLTLVGIYPSSHVAIGRMPNHLHVTIWCSCLRCTAQVPE